MFDWQIRVGIKLGVTLACLATSLVVLRHGPRRPENVFLSFFLAVVGIGYALNAWQDAIIAPFHDESPFQAERVDVFRAEMVFNILDPILLLYFASVFPRRSRLNDLRIFGVLGAAAVVLIAMALARPMDFLGGWVPFERDGYVSILNIPPGRILYGLFVIGCYATAFLALVRAWAGVPREDDRGSVGLVVLATGVAVLPRIGSVLWEVLFQEGLAIMYVVGGEWRMPVTLLPQIVSPRLRTWMSAAAFLVHAAVLAGAWFVFRRAGRGIAANERRRIEVPMFALAFGFALLSPLNHIGSVLYGPNFFLGPLTAASFSMRWLVFSAIVGYALLSSRLFDFEVRAKRSFSAALVVATSLLVCIGGLGLTILVWDHANAPALIGSVLVGAVSAGVATPWARRLAARAFPRADDPQFLAERKLQVLRAAMADARASGLDPLTDRAVVRFRKSLGLSEEAHRALAVEPQVSSPHSEPLPVLPGSCLFGRYEIHDLLGTGASGRTWRARDILLDREVAVKHVFGRPKDEGGEGVSRYLRETRAAGAVRHENVVRVFDAREAGPDYFLVMEHVPGGPLAEKLAREAPLPPREVASLLDGVLSGLEAVHAVGFLHRDVKPGNVLLAMDGTPKLADFGVAHVPGLEGTVTRLGGSARVGTDRYMAPEQKQGLPLDARADLYAAAVVAHEALTGEPFEGRLDLASVPASPELRAAVARGLAARAGDRWTDAATFRAAVGRTMEGAEEPRASRGKK